MASKCEAFSCATDAVEHLDGTDFPLSSWMDDSVVKYKFDVDHQCVKWKTEGGMDGKLEDSDCDDTKKVLCRATCTPSKYLIHIFIYNG